MSQAAAERYAGALFELASEKNAVEDVGQGLLAVRKALQADAGAAKTFFAPRVPATEKRRLADQKLLTGVHPLVAKLVRLLIDRRREGSLWSLILCFFELKETAEGILRLTIETARPLDDAARTALVAKLSSATGKKVLPEIVDNADLLGGMRITIGSTRIDGSLKRALESLGKRLKAAV
ncbi:MAG: ATP synthase F1 subunit delta [Planctomycetes bacterium]|nr:ATP synthase F1 subunit delta [Planctomycetota bacterium]